MKDLSTDLAAGLRQLESREMDQQIHAVVDLGHVVNRNEDIW